MNKYTGNPTCARLCAAGFTVSSQVSLTIAGYIYQYLAKGRSAFEYPAPLGRKKLFIDHNIKCQSEDSSSISTTSFIPSHGCPCFAVKMEIATAAQPRSRHQKCYVPIMAGTLGGCDLALIVGLLFYLFWRRRRQASRKSITAPYDSYSCPMEEQIPFAHHPEPPIFGYLPLHTEDPLAYKETTNLPWDGTAEDVVFSSYNDVAATATGETPLADWGLQNLPSAQGSIPPLSLRHECPHWRISPFNIDLEAGDPGAWDSNANLSSLGTSPFANVDFETNFDLDYQNSNASTVTVDSYLEPSREEEDPLDIDLELGNPVDRDLNVYLSGSRALPFASSNLQKNSAFDHQNSSPPSLPATSDLVPSHKDDFLAWCNNASSSSQPERISNSPLAPSASNTELPNDLTLSPLQTTVEPLVSHPPSQALQKPDSLPLPPAAHLRCPNCSREVSSRLRLE